MTKEFVLAKEERLTIREISDLEVYGGVSFETYKLTSTTLIKNGTFEDYKKEASIYKDYPILLPSKFTCQ